MKIIKSEISQWNIHSTKRKTNLGQNNTCEVQIFTENFRPTFTSLLLFLPALQLLAILDIFRVNSILAVETKNGKARKLVLAVRIEASAILEDFVNDGESLGRNTEIRHQSFSFITTKWRSSEPYSFGVDLSLFFLLNRPWFVENLVFFDKGNTQVIRNELFIVKSDWFVTFFNLEKQVFLYVYWFSLLKYIVDNSLKCVCYGSENGERSFRGE